MKRFLTIVLALIMTLALCAPALAFTSVEYSDEDGIGPSLAIKLVDVQSGFVSINFSAAPSNRGYLKNEVVCAVVSLFVPKNYVFSSNFYTAMEFYGKNVSLYQEDNFYGSLGTGGTLNYMSRNAVDALGGKGRFSYSTDMSYDNTIILGSAGLADLDYSLTTSLTKDTTYQFAVFGKVISEEAAMGVRLVGLGGLLNSTDNDEAAGYFNVVKLDDDYAVGYHNPNRSAYTGSDANGTTLPLTVEEMLETGAGVDSKIQLSNGQIAFIVFDANSSDAASTPYDLSGAYFIIITDKNYNCKSMFVYYPNATQRWYLVKVVSRSNENAEYAKFWNCYVQFEYYDQETWYVETKGVVTSYLLRFICEDIIYDSFGLNPALSGQMKDSWWSRNKEIVAEVSIEPWYAEVTVPTEIEITAPKTGGEVSAIGAMLVMLAGLALVAARKLRSSNS